MPDESGRKPQYTRYRAGRAVLPARGGAATGGGRLLDEDADGRLPGHGAGGAGEDAGGQLPGAGGTPRRPRPPLTAPGARPSRWRQRITPKRVALGLLALVVGWVVLSLALFLVSSHFRRVSPPANVAGELEPAGFGLTSANNILVLGSDKRQQDSKEPGADPNGPSRSDSIMLIRTGGDHAARLSIPRDTVVEIPGHGLQKINAAYAYGGPAESIAVIKHYLGVPINHVIEVNFENFPELVEAMGGITYTGGCVVSYIDGGSADGGFTLRLSAGTHQLDGREALALARTRENRCAPQQTDLQREERQQKLLLDMKSQLLSFSSFLRLPLIAWNAPPTIISDMSGPELLAVFAALEIGGSAPTHLLQPTGQITLPDGEEGLTVSEASKRTAVARFMAG
ncbi:MAG TPA: LCP family protein [Solirubrobacteraceae bacterium]|jgi:LCP family protein required for cell wall assembly|nr:LCP family protein [Solirubrobacteraceae bacterium]